jgi:hypothetical protein
MHSYEIQLFKGGKWEFDSYFDDRDSAMSDAEQLAADIRIQGVRVLKEHYDQDSNIATCDVIYTRRRNTRAPDQGRKTTQKTARHNPQPTGARGVPRRSARHKQVQKKSGSPVKTLVVFALVLLIGGVATLLGLGGLLSFS